MRQLRESKVPDERILIVDDSLRQQHLGPTAPQEKRGKAVSSCLGGSFSRIYCAIPSPVRIDALPKMC